MTFRNIVVPVDGSRFAEAALRYAVELARTAKAKLHLVLAHEPAPALVGMGEGLPTIDVEEATYLRERTYLAETAGDLLRLGSEVEFRELEGPAGPAIAEAVTRLEADLVVMATHGRGALGRLWLGSVADYLVRNLPVPVLLIHRDRKQEPARIKLHSILVATDLSPASEAILEPVVALAQLTNGYVTLIHVIEPMPGLTEPGVPYPVPIDPRLLENQREAAQRDLDRLADRLRGRGISACAKVRDASGAATGLLDALGEERYDLLALTTQGRGGVRRLLLGSVADKAIRGALKPVLVMRPK